MINIWGVLQQTVEVSLAALLLFALGKLFTDKLSPRWQYGIWSLLALRILLPVGLFGRYLIPRLAVHLEAAKATVEEGLHSAYTVPYAPLRVSSLLPEIQSMPLSVTDWLFILYLVGVLIYWMKLLVSYIQLRLLLRCGQTPQAEQQAALAETCARYQLKPCRMVCIEGLPSAFICGIISPILAVPQDEVLDEKMLLHELLHKRYADPLQSLLWSILRALHWYNPFLHCIFRRIGNDMERLCDQRVLERLEGEARRDYGRILLAMTNARYPRAPGTSSISNGAQQITRRIEAIVRFQKYPRGMALVSVCIALLLLPCLLGVRSSKAMPDISFEGQGSALELTTNSEAAWQLSLAMAAGRQSTCSSIAGAADTFAKALLLKNPVYLAATTPSGAQAALMQSVKEGKFPIVLPEEPTQHVNEFYSLHNLQAEGADYTALLILNAYQERWDAETGVVGSPLGCGLPIRFVYEEGWRVVPTGDFVYLGALLNSHWVEQFKDTQHIISYEAYGADYHIRVDHWTEAEVESSKQAQAVPFMGVQMFGTSGFDRRAYPDAKFDTMYQSETVRYRFTGTQEARARIQSSVGFITKPLENEQTQPEKADAYMPLSNARSSHSDGTNIANQSVDATWDGTLGGGGGHGSSQWKEPKFPWAYSADIYEDDVLVDSIILRKVEKK